VFEILSNSFGASFASRGFTKLLVLGLCVGDPSCTKSGQFLGCSISADLIFNDYYLVLGSYLPPRFINVPQILPRPLWEQTCDGTPQNDKSLSRPALELSTSSTCNATDGRTNCPYPSFPSRDRALKDILVYSPVLAMLRASFPSLKLGQCPLPFCQTLS